MESGGVGGGGSGHGVRVVGMGGQVGGGMGGRRLEGGRRGGWIEGGRGERKGQWAVDMEAVCMVGNDETTQKRKYN